jgi:hypothetical protein
MSPVPYEYILFTVYVFTIHARPLVSLDLAQQIMP